MAAASIRGTFRIAHVFSTSIAVYSRGFVPFIVLTILASIPSYLVQYAFGTEAGKNADGYAAAISIAQSLLVNMTQTLASGAVIYGVVQQLRGRTFSVADSIQVVLHRFLPLVGVVICTNLAMFLGLFMLIFPGIILACMYYVSMPVCIAERTGVFESMSRSSFLTKGHRWQVVGASVLFWAVAAIFLFVVAAVIGGVWTMVFSGVGETGTLVGIEVPMVVVNSFGGVLISVFYYELRVAKEGVDIDKIAGVFD